jgi:hypothetical protein
LTVRDAARVEATTDLADWGEGWYQFDLIDPFGHVQRVMADTCELEEGRSHA